MPRCSLTAPFLWLVLSGLSACAGSPTGDNPAPGPTIGNPPATGAGARVLFIGNSLAEGNDLSGRSPVGLPTPGSVHAVTAERLQRAALEALDRYASYVPNDGP